MSSLDPQTASKAEKQHRWQLWMGHKQQGSLMEGEMISANHVRNLEQGGGNKPQSLVPPEIPAHNRAGRYPWLQKKMPPCVWVELSEPRKGQLLPPLRTLDSSQEARPLRFTLGSLKHCCHSPGPTSGPPQLRPPRITALLTSSRSTLRPHEASLFSP